MPRRSTVEALPKDDLDALNRQLQDGKVTLDELIEWLEERGHEISRSALGRHKKKIDEVGEHLRRSRQMTEALVKEVGPQVADGAQGKLLVEILQTLTFDLLSSSLDGEEKFDPENLMFLGRMMKDMASAQKIDADRVSKIEEAALKKAAARAGEAAKGKGLTGDTVKAIRESVLGVKT